MKTSSSELIKSSSAFDPTSNIRSIQNRRYQQKPADKSPITRREGECLSWAAIGKTASEIAEILNISEHTVHFHTKNAIKKLDAANKTHAVVKAILGQYITVK
ncbi:MAG: helix-turn-helix transcriptional regulator [Thiotrichaceae bacterium]